VDYFVWKENKEKYKLFAQKSGFFSFWMKSDKNPSRRNKENQWKNLNYDEVYIKLLITPAELKKKFTFSI
jgi:hypothetical protein